MNIHSKRGIALLLALAALLAVGCGAEREEATSPAADPALPLEPAAEPTPEATPNEGTDGSVTVPPVPEAPEIGTVRVSIAFAEGVALNDGISAVEEALGHPLDVVWRFEDIGVVSVNLAEREIALVESVEAVRSAEKELLNEPQGGTAPDVVTGRVSE